MTTPILANVSNILTPVTLVAGDNVSIAYASNAFSLAFTGNAPTGSMLQQSSLSLANSCIPTLAYSATYNSSAQFGSITITTLSANSTILVIMQPIFVLQNGVSCGAWITSQPNAPLCIAAQSFSEPTTTQAYYSSYGIGWYANNTAGLTYTINFCGFYSPYTAYQQFNRILGSTDGFSYSGQLSSKFIVQEIQA